MSSLLKSFRTAICALLLTTSVSPLWAHGPIFMREYETPAKGVIDLHSGIHGTTDGQDLEIAQAVAYGLSRYVGGEVEVPFDLIEKQITETSLSLTWRMLNFDRLNQKQAIIANGTDKINLPRDSNAGTTRESFAGGLGYLLEKLRWTVIADVSVERSEPSKTAADSTIDTVGTAPTSPEPVVNADQDRHEIWMSQAVGYRFLHIPKTQSDMMFFLESNIRLANPNVQFLAPELEFQPNGRMLLKAGYRFPVWHAKGDTDEKSQWAFQFEFRF